MASVRLIVCSLALFGSACATTDFPPAGGQEAKATQKAAPEPLTGTLAPVQYEALSLWPLAFGGELLVLEALPQGASVAQGDVLVRLDTVKIDEQIRAAELALASAEIAHAGLLARNVLASEAAADELLGARARLDRATRALEAFTAREALFTQRGDELRARFEQQSIDDRVDELAQVEAMYAADELVDATEEIVLKRSRRDLETARFSNALSADRRAFEVDFSRPLQLEQRQEEVALQAAGVARLERSQAIDADARADAQARSALALEDKRSDLVELRSDLELFTLRAPMDGVLLHGDVDDYRPGSKAPLVERGSRLAPRSDVLLVADPLQMAVTFDLGEVQRAGLQTGARLDVRPLSLPGQTLAGELEIEDFPAARPAGKDGALFAARVTLAPGSHGLLFGMQAKVDAGGAP